MNFADEANQGLCPGKFQRNHHTSVKVKEGCHKDSAYTYPS